MKDFARGRVNVAGVWSAAVVRSLASQVMGTSVMMQGVEKAGTVVSSQNTELGVEVTVAVPREMAMHLQGLGVPLGLKAELERGAVGRTVTLKSLLFATGVESPVSWEVTT